MYLIFVNYKKPLAEVEKYVAAHRSYLEKYYETGDLICSGPRNPRVGGIILCRAANMKAAKVITLEDPFFLNGIADYEIIEFDPVKRAPAFEQFVR